MAERDRVRIAIIGAGLGGTAAATLLQRAGFNVKLYEQAYSFARTGAGIHLAPNVMKVMRRIGIEERLVEIGVRPASYISRAWDTGEVKLEVILKVAAEARYGAPYLMVHRGDFHEALVSCLAPGTLEFGKRLVGLRLGTAMVNLEFDDRTNADADFVIGADGVHSKIREILLGPERPTYSGHVAHRSVFSASLLGDLNVHDYTKWWSPDRHFVVYFVTRARDEIYFVTDAPQAEWSHDSWTAECDREELLQTFEGFHPEILRIMEACREVSKWALLERNPLPLWTRDRIVLLGDACHPMKPSMAQGAAMAIEDAAMLARCLTEGFSDDLNFAFHLYAANRIGRTAKVQQESHVNTWLRDTADPDWVWGYDAFTEPLVHLDVTHSARMA